MKQRLLAVCKALGMFELSRRLTRRKLRILCYHGLWLGGEPHYGDCLFIDATHFKERMEWLAASCYSVLPLDEALDRLDHCTLPDNPVVITIDDGWHSTYRGMLPVLTRLSLPATAVCHHSLRTGRWTGQTS
jgi:peptidoglycan/xylan/chitin deacetylase (PgdA/CDA1 family)